MSRSPVTVRPAVLADAAALAGLWGDVLRRADPDEQVRDVESLIASAGGREDRLVAVAELDGDVAGAVLLRVDTMTPLNLEPVVQVVSPHVLPGRRRRGVGTALMEAAVRFAEEQGVALLASAAMSDSRDANRFMARLSLAPQAVLRVATTQAVRSRLSSRRPALSRESSHRIDKVLAARRVWRGERSSG